MKYFSFYFLLVAIGICCLANNPPQQTHQSLAVKAINDIIEPWYQGKNTPCENGTFKIQIADTLKWRDFKYTSNAEVEIVLDGFGVNLKPYVIASAIRATTPNIDFTHNRVSFIRTLSREPLCTQYYFSNLYSTKNDNEFVIQYISNSFELIEEIVLLLQYDGSKFIVKDHLSAKSVWF